jgi:hypothetical protein
VSAGLGKAGEEDLELRRQGRLFAQGRDEMTPRVPCHEISGRPALEHTARVEDEHFVRQRSAMSSSCVATSTVVPLPVRSWSSRQNARLDRASSPAVGSSRGAARHRARARKRGALACARRRRGGRAVDRGGFRDRGARRLA